MLIDKTAFENVETILHNNGSIQRFESESGKILGRMMITLGEIPANLGIEQSDGARAFIGSFDFYDSEVGIAINPRTKELSSGLWVTPQKEGAEAPAQDWIEFFLKTLVDSFGDDGSFGVPIYAFVNDTTSMTVIPGNDMLTEENFSTKCAPNTGDVN